MSLIIGTAGWAVPAKERAHFTGEGTALQRYARRFGGVEINSSFHRSHRISTWQRWAESVPAGFRFSVKLPKSISHIRKLADCSDLVRAFVDEIEPLDEKLAILLLQLPPKLAFDLPLVRRFLGEFPLPPAARLVCEPRHASWFEADADAVLDQFQVARVAADPACAPAAAAPGGWRGLSYMRLHGSPHIYRSSYEGDRLRYYAERMLADRNVDRPSWCIFDNSASGAATGDALALSAQLADPGD